MKEATVNKKVLYLPKPILVSTRLPQNCCLIVLGVEHLPETVVSLNFQGRYK